MKLRAIIKMLGGFSVILGLIILIPGIFSILDGDRFTLIFTTTSCACCFFGGLLWGSQRNFRGEIDHRSALALVSFAWVLAGILGALPFYLSGTVAHFFDAFFESISGFTGTGASVIADVERVDRSILLWRSMTQWLGGMGIIVFFIAVLPFLGFGSVQLYKAEVAGPHKEKLTPRVSATARKLWQLYVAFTIILILLLWHTGMGLFDAVNHGLTGLGSGGFSTRNAGIAAFQNRGIDIVLSVFMLIAAINFSIHYRILVERDVRALQDTELKAFLAIIIGSIALVSWSLYNTGEHSLRESLISAFFIISSTASSTGFSNHNYIPWPPLTHVIIVLLMVMGGMSGSTAGGLKCIRLVAAFKQLQRQLKQVVHPKAVIPVKANNHIIPDHVIDAIWGLIFLYFLVFTVAILILAAEGLDILTATTASFSALSNIGPALGELGPTATYAALGIPSKSILMLCMLLGRLEFFTLFVIFTPTYWKR